MSQSVVGMILAAGFGTRLRPLTDYRPKAIIEIAGKPIIYHQIKMLEQAGIENIYINTHYLSDKIIDTVESLEIESNIFWSVEEQILGTAGGMARMLTKFDIKAAEMLVLNGDMICDIDLASVLNKNHFCALICAKDRSLNGYVGGVSVDSDNHIVELGRFYKNNNQAVANGFFTGIHVFSSDALDLIKQASYSCLVSELYPHWLKNNSQIVGYMIDMAYEDLGSIERLFEANMAISENPYSYKHLNFAQNLIKPGLIMGDGVIIDHGAFIGPRVVIGDHVRVGEGAKISNSVIMSDTIIEKNECLDCVVALSGARVLVKM